jgi:hypothetical protein
VFAPDGDERIVDAVSLVGSPQIIEFHVPAEFDPIDLYIRCRLTSDFAGLPLPTGQAADGEVEDLLLTAEILSVAISSFDAFVKERDVVLSWTTRREDNLAGFRIEQVQSEDQFIEVGYTHACGSAGNETDYELSLANVPFGRHRFRLVSIDLDGTADVGPEVEVIVEMTDALVLDPAYPNPFNPATVVRFALKETGPAMLDLYSIDGKRIQRIYEGVADGGVSHTVRIDGTRLPSGVYLVRLTANGRIVDRTVTLVR